MKQPFKGYFRISQLFGENINPSYKAQGLKGHTGIDFVMPTGTPVYSAVDGKVIVKSIDIARGEGVGVLSSEIYKYNGQDCFMDTIYWHMKDESIVVKVGDVVKAGQLLGLSNNTGNSTGPHLHFSIIPMAPDGSRMPLAPNNGYTNCIDPMPYLTLEKPQITLKQGMRGDEVKTLQQQLSVVADGIFGPLTKKAVIDFQKAHGLTPDGIVGPLTHQQLDTLTYA